MLIFPNLICQTLLYFIQLVPFSSQNNDYWSEDFDMNHNCEKPDEISKLKSMKPSQCIFVKGEEDKRAFSLCKTQLTEMLQKKCDYTKVENAGELLYCKQRGALTCCFAHETCDSWASIQNSIYANAKEYLTNRRSVLNNMVKTMGYNTCHHLNSLDASKCADDCKNLEKGDFAKKCKSDGGFFKCCIRRDKKNCHECRYCCTLPMCTKPPGGRYFTEFDGLVDIKLESHKNQLKANDLFFSKEYIYKNDDYHCLKPDSHKNKREWRKYDMEKYRQAYNQETLDKVPTFKYDNKLYNFVNPKVFKSFTKNERYGRKTWRKTYGYYYTKQIPGFQANPQFNKTLVATVCFKKCNQMENSKFARNCRKDGGYFKCCGSYWWLDTFEEARNMLIKEGLVKAKESHVCNQKAKMKNPCLYCSMNGICTKTNPMTGELIQLYYPRTTPIPPGIWDAATFDLRYNWCLVLDLCSVHKHDRAWYDKILFQKATNKEEVCAAATMEKSDVESKQKIKPKELCKKLYKGNFYLCSDGDKKKVINKRMLSLSNKLENRIKNPRQKYSRKSSKKRKKGKKRRSRYKKAPKKMKKRKTF